MTQTDILPFFWYCYRTDKNPLMGYFSCGVFAMPGQTTRGVCGMTLWVTSTGKYPVKKIQWRHPNSHTARDQGERFYSTSTDLLLTLGSTLNALSSSPCNVARCLYKY